MVVAILFLPEPCLSSEYIPSPGSLSVVERSTRRGIDPPSALRRSIMYSISGEFSPGWKNGAEPVCS